MGLTGIQILGMLPKKNCKECGFPTCLAFAMKVAAGQADIAACPYVSEEVKEKIAEASAPPIRTVKLGSGDHTLAIGGETVLFRHEKRFEHPPGIGILLSTDMAQDEIEERLARFKKLRWERVGVKLKPEVVAIEDSHGEAGKMAEVVKIVREKAPEAVFVLMSEKKDVLAAGAKECGEHKALLYGVTLDNLKEMAELAKETKFPLGVKADSLGEAARIAEELMKEGIKDIVLDTGPRGIRELYEDQVIMRRAAIKKRFKPFGFPSITFPFRFTDNIVTEYMIASVLVAKYAGMIILSDFRADLLFPLMVERMNIFTDPQRPLVVEEGIYPLNGPDENSPVIVTCNFALTYFIVSGEVEGSRVPTWLLIKDTEGLSVLTAWAAGKFGADTIAEFVKKCGIADKVKHRKLIIPGYLAGIKGELEEELPDWEIVIGPREASGLPSFLKEWKAA
ncbi:acetyl-CoA decarbonylase/synthase complex subunit gamma [Thermodesulfatator autotrophicus]|uniref:Acetyl-CoA decarbonylase/synthase complex subunit gamma n=1 Tax=Thermodesulfatator autotrophicus TaxID=1795632 RepID=A0A177E789_9BACT|nr:acetyl-CoA decarbonylase/synthase complex subunit gamma [Thermodesulfatator autotrophicus]OAG27092.1 acetyl-CoA decarbonylase/synthase complex subunit gamma [Thermodesulfatator autotrophicus]